MSRRIGQELSSFTPLPPARNGIADYAYILLGELVNLRPCVVYCDDVLASAPAGIEVRDEAQAFRYLDRTTPVLHQLGNNGGHVFVLEALRRYRGLVSLHDLSLLYLYELSTPRLEPLLAGMQSQDCALGTVFGRQWKDHRLKTSSNYVLFDMVGEVLSLADGVIVHSQFGLNKLRAIYGTKATSKIAVIPHFAPRLKITSQAEARKQLGLSADELIVLTSGFATRAKRFDWLIEALDTLLERGIALRWVHAGEERPTEFHLQQAIDRRPRLREAATITGYVSEDDLDAYIAAADLVVNLRFPSVGESSGTLARALSAGRCCIVNDTATYAEIPREAVVHIPILDTVPALVRAMEALLGDSDLRALFGERARSYARSALALEGVAKQYSDFVDSIHASASQRANRTPRRSIDKSPSPRASAPRTVEIEGVEGMQASDLRHRIAGIEGAFEAVLWFGSADDMARYSLDRPGFLQGAFGPHVTIEAVRLLSRPADPGAPRPPASNQRAGVGLSILGHAHGW